MMECIDNRLQVSRIGGVRVVQVGESVLSGENNHVNSHKIGISFMGNGENNTIDLGKGAEKYSIKVHAENRQDKEKLLNIIKNERFTTVVDKFFGTIDVYVESYRVVNSDEHANMTIFELQLVKQDGVSSPFTSFFSLLVGFISLFFPIIGAAISAVAAFVSTDTYISTESGKEEFIDENLNTLYHGIKEVQNTKINRKKYTNTSTKNRELFVSLKNIHTRQDIVSDIFKEIAEEKQTGVWGGADRLPKIHKLEDLPPAQIGQIETKRRNEVSALINLVALSREINGLFNYEFQNMVEFERYVSRVLDRVEHTYIDNKAEVISSIKAYVKTKNYRKIITVNVKDPSPLQRIVYEHQGNLDLYQDIVSINGNMDNDRLQGEVKLYASDR